MNKVFLIGNVCHDLDIRKFANDNPYLTFTIACNRKFTKKSGEKVDEATFVRCIAYGKVAEIIKDFGYKGQKIAIEGRLKVAKFKKEGEEKETTSTEVVVTEFEFLTRKPREDKPSEPADEENTFNPDAKPEPAEEKPEDESLT